MMHCQGCVKDVHPVYDFGPSMKAVAMCPTCGCELRESVATMPPVVARVCMPELYDVLAAVKARLATVRGLITDTRSLESEAAMLERMLLAAAEIEAPITHSAPWPAEAHAPKAH